MTATITDVRLAAAHEGVAEIVVSLTFSNSGQSQIPLDHIAAAYLMQSCNALEVEELIGQSWEKVRDALTVAYNGSDDVGRHGNTRNEGNSCSI